jgi:thymidine phosphorylase
VGVTAKVRSAEAAHLLSERMTEVGRAIGLTVRTVITDGAQPVGRGIGPALEARDVLSVLRGDPHAPQDLRERALMLAGMVIEFSDKVSAGEGYSHARQALEDGRAWQKFLAICQAQGGFREPAMAAYTKTLRAEQRGHVTAVDNRRLARIAKLAGAPSALAAGLDLHVCLGQVVEQDEPLFTIHSESPGELAYAAEYVAAQVGIIKLEGHE